LFGVFKAGMLPPILLVLGLLSVVAAVLSALLGRRWALGLLFGGLALLFIAALMTPAVE
jgi:hypothetical protein